MFPPTNGKRVLSGKTLSFSLSLLDRLQSALAKHVFFRSLIENAYWLLNCFVSFLASDGVILIAELLYVATDKRSKSMFLPFFSSCSSLLYAVSFVVRMALSTIEACPLVKCMKTLLFFKVVSSL